MGETFSGTMPMAVIWPGAETFVRVLESVRSGDGAACREVIAAYLAQVELVAAAPCLICKRAVADGVHVHLDPKGEPLLVTPSCHACTQLDHTARNALLDAAWEYARKVGPPWALGLDGGTLQ